MKRLLAAALAFLPLLSACARGEAPSAPDASSAPPIPESSAPPQPEPEPSPVPPMLAAYLPASTPPDALGEYAPSLALLDRVTVITGLCWDESGEVQILDGNFAALLDALRETPVSLYATVYPQRGLIQAGRAGASVDTPEKRAALAENLLRFAKAHGLDGIDVDWETPSGEEEWLLCSETLVTLSHTLGQEGVALSAALYPENTDKLKPEAKGALTSLNLMTYDQFDADGYHATFDMLRSAVDGALRQGYAPGQIHAGIPAYGRPVDGAARWPLYRDAGLAADEDVRDGVYYNSADLAAKKAAYAKEQELGGVFFYHLAGDLPADQPLSLLRAASEAVS